MQIRDTENVNRGMSKSPVSVDGPRVESSWRYRSLDITQIDGVGRVRDEVREYEIAI